jgi:PTH1 family peptidyl-tRNA hydrolase
VKLVVGLGNPGPEYDATRHNVGWWMADRLAYDWSLGAFHREGDLLVAAGERRGEPVRVVKPTAYMNRSGPALAPFLATLSVDPTADLLVVVDDVALDVGRVRFRPGGGAGGHNGLGSVEETLATRAYARLRIGVGTCPEGEDLVEWVLSTLPPEDETVVVELLPELSQAVDVWIDEGIEAAMNRFNR